MGKNILVISSSPRKGGNSDTLCDRFVAGAEAAGHQAEKLFLKEQTIHYCTGCGACVKTSRCVQKDDMAAILDKMIAADVIVMATPVYFYSMAGQLKSFIDRCCARYREISGKDFYFILTAADDRKAAMKQTVEALRGFTSCLSDAKEKGVIYGLGVWERGDIQKSPAMQEAYELANAIR